MYCHRDTLKINTSVCAQIRDCLWKWFLIQDYQRSRICPPLDDALETGSNFPTILKPLVISWIILITKKFGWQTSVKIISATFSEIRKFSEINFVKFSISISEKNRAASSRNKSSPRYLSRLTLPKNRGKDPYLGIRAQDITSKIDVKMPAWIYGHKNLPQKSRSRCVPVFTVLRLNLKKRRKDACLDSWEQENTSKFEVKMRAQKYRHKTLHQKLRWRCVPENTGTQLYLKYRGKDSCLNLRAQDLTSKIEVNIHAWIFAHKTLPHRH